MGPVGGPLGDPWDNCPFRGLFELRLAVAPALGWPFFGCLPADLICYHLWQTGWVPPILLDVDEEFTGRQDG